MNIIGDKVEFNGKMGVWRTIGGRRIFISDGQSLPEAMRVSGKFPVRPLMRIGTKKNLRTDVTEIIDNIEKYKNCTKEELTKHFKRRYPLGNNPYTGKPVIVLGKDLSHFIYKHAIEENYPFKEIKNIDTILERIQIVYRYERDPNQLRMYVKESNGYIECGTKPIMGGREEMIHFLFKNEKSAKKAMKKYNKKNLLLKNYE